MWNLSFLGLGMLVPCEPNDPRFLFVDGNGQGWKQRHRKALVAPDNPDERGEPTMIWRDVEAPVPLLGPPPGEPLPELLLTLALAA